MFNIKMKEKEEQRMMEERMREEQQLRKEEEERKEIRKQMVFKASRVRRFKGVDGAKISEKALTVPQMPNLRT